MAHAFYEASALKWVNDVTKILDNNNVSMLELLLQTLRHGHNIRSMIRHHRSLTEAQNVSLVLALLEEKAPETAYSQALLTSEKVYRNEISALIQKSRGLHFGARTATLEQMENFCIEDLSVIMQESCPGLWKLLLTLLDVNGERRKVYDTGVSGSVQGNDEEYESDLDTEDEEDFVYSDSESEEDEPNETSEGQIDENGDVPMGNVDLPLDTPRKKQTRRTQNRAARDRALVAIKRVVIISILGQSSNERFNSLQCFVGYFLESKHTPEIVLELVSHMGLSVSNQSIRNINNSLSMEAKRRLRSLPNVLNSIHDNFDMDFNVAQPTVENRKVHWSATAATFVNYRDINPDQDLRFVKELRLTSPFNDDIRPENRTTLTPSFTDILPRAQKAGKTMKDVFAWHLRAILVEQGGDIFSVFKARLGKPEVVEGLSYAEKDVSIPASAIDANEGTYDGNWEVLENLYHQRNVPESVHDEYLTFIHGDLATKERIDGLRRSRRIEATAKNRLDNVLFVVGLFHVLMAAANAIWRLHILPHADRSEDLGLFNYINILRPKATGEFTSKNGPSYHSMHNVAHHALWADVLNIWRVETRKRFSHDNLKSWGNRSHPGNRLSAFRKRW
ncbi:hypothetical protein PM082_018886 [Marasmius tenuissimus]|nr:hypothetical protein PM082_018886 [Marasmius tenuissimus]